MIEENTDAAQAYITDSVMPSSVLNKKRHNAAQKVIHI